MKTKMKSYDSFFIDVENKKWFRENYLGKKSAIINFMIGELKKAKENNKDRFTIIIE